MGQSLSPSLHGYDPDEDSTIVGYQELHLAGAYQEEVAKETQVFVAELDRGRAPMSQNDANSDPKQVTDELERVKTRLDEIERIARRAQQLAQAAFNASWATAARGTPEAQGEHERSQTIRVAEAASAARRVQELAEVAANAAREEAVRLARSAQEERERAQSIRRDAERAMAAAREEAERAQKAVEEQRRKAEAGRALAEEMARIAAEESRKAIAVKAEAERRLKEGIRPIIMPSTEDIAATKRRIQYREGYVHFAVAGISGSGKSSLINAFRGLRSRDAGAAPVGITARTLEVTRYSDANPENPFVWYEIPGAGTLKCRGWQYFNDQGLYVFDCIVVLFDNRFTMTDIAVLINARRFNIPTYIVRSKADQHIRHIMLDMGYDSEEDEEEDIERRNRLYEAARKQFIEKTRESVKVNLEDANLPDQRVYIVSNGTLLSIVLNKMPKKTIDEAELFHDLVGEHMVGCIVE